MQRTHGRWKMNGGGRGSTGLAAAPFAVVWRRARLARRARVCVCRLDDLCMVCVRLCMDCVRLLAIACDSCAAAGGLGAMACQSA
jgi:hypothetical protein